MHLSYVFFLGQGWKAILHPIIFLSATRITNHDPLYINNPIPESPDLYYEKLTTARLITDKWNILTYFNIIDILSIGQDIRKLFEELIPYCKEANRTNFCIREKHALGIKSPHGQITKYIYRINIFLNNILEGWLSDHARVPTVHSCVETTF